MLYRYPGAMRGRLVLSSVLLIAAACASGERAPAPSTSPIAAPDPVRIGPPSDLAPPSVDPTLGFHAAAGALATQGSTYESAVDRSGVVEIVPRRAAGRAGQLVTARGAPLTLETISVARGARVLSGAGGSASLAADGAVNITR